MLSMALLPGLVVTPSSGSAPAPAGTRARPDSSSPEVGPYR
jgi:hypothetical protein